MLSVIVPARDAEATIGRTLAALAAQRIAEPYEVIVVDDGSRDATAAIARAAAGPVTVLTQDASGPAAARNLGVGHARGDRLAFCDADVFPAQAGWPRARPRWRTTTSCRGASPPTRTRRGGRLTAACTSTGRSGCGRRPTCSSRARCLSASVALRRGSPRGCGKALAEDVWFGHRALRAGARAGFSPEALAHHAVFARGARGYVAERARLRFFPAMAARMPELRTAFLHGRVFLNARSARFDLAAAGLLLAAPRRPGWRRRTLGLLAAAPYGLEVRSASARAPGRPPGRARVAAADVAADAVGAVALAWGSLRYRSMVL